MSLTGDLLRSIGSPLLTGGRPPAPVESWELLGHAARNKVPMLYLDALRRSGRLDALRSRYDGEAARCRDFLDATSRASGVLSAAGVEHAVFKSLKPYPGRGGDVDIIVFGHDGEYRKAVGALLRERYVPVLEHLRRELPAADDGSLEAYVRRLTTPTFGRRGHISPTGTDLFDPVHPSIMVDLQKDIGVSHLVYLDKRKLRPHARQVPLPGGAPVAALGPEAELVAVIAHSVMEQMYLVGEFYSLVYSLASMDRDGIGRLAAIARESRVAGAVGTFAAITAGLHRAAFGAVPGPLEGLLEEVGAPRREAQRLERRGFAMPHRYSLGTVAGYLIGKLRERRFASTVPVQVARLMDPRLASLVARELVAMRRRDSYGKG